MTKKKSEKTEEKKVSEETVAEETETENTEEPAKDENADKIRLLKMSFRHRRISICDLPPSTTITVKERQTKSFQSLTMQLQRLVSSFFPLQTA